MFNMNPQPKVSLEASGWTSLLTALGIGLVIGFYLGRKARNGQPTVQVHPVLPAQAAVNSQVSGMSGLGCGPDGPCAACSARAAISDFQTEDVM